MRLGEGARALAAAIGLAVGGENAMAQEKPPQTEITHVEHVAGDNGTVLVDEDGIISPKDPNAKKTDSRKLGNDIGKEHRVVLVRDAGLEVPQTPPNNNDAEANAAREAQHQRDKAEVEEGGPHNPAPERPVDTKVAAK